MPGGGGGGGGGVNAIRPLGTTILLTKPPPGAGLIFIPTRVPRIPAVPTGDSMLKLDFLSNFLMSTTISPISRSIRVSEELGSPSNSESFVAPGSNLAWVNFLILRAESALTVVTVPFDKSKMILDAGPVLTVCPSKRIPPALTLPGGKATCVALLMTVTCPSRPAMMIAPFGSIVWTSCCPTSGEKNKKGRIKKIVLLFIIVSFNG